MIVKYVHSITGHSVLNKNNNKLKIRKNKIAKTKKILVRNSKVLPAEKPVILYITDPAIDAQLVTVVFDLHKLAQSSRLCFAIRRNKPTENWH